MSTKDNNSGLLSKVAKFVRNPTTNWTDLDKQDPEPDTGYSKQALKEMIERKRQNDFVRRREFDQLRKLRSRDPTGGNPDLAGRPSYFQSSLPSNPNERAMTIKKIDEIEAQMSNQWWQGKNEGARPADGAVAPPTPAAPALAASGSDYAATKATPLPTDQAYAATKLTPLATESSYAPTGLTQLHPESAYEPTKLTALRPESAYEPTKLTQLRPDAGGGEQADFLPTQTNSSFGKNLQTIPAPAAAGASMGVHRVASTAIDKTGDRPGFANSQSFAVELIEGVTDPDLEEAAIRFANGDDAGAEGGLITALQGDDVRRDLIALWTSALFDLYRATGQQSRFDTVAIEYAERFGRSAPAWFSMPDVLGLNHGSATARTEPSRLVGEPIWRSPPRFARATVDELRLAVANAAAPWFLDWRDLTALEPGASEALGELFSEWCTTAVQLRFAGSDGLERALRSCTPSGDKSVGQALWRLRMDALRIMQLQDEFELVALDYCVTYEVSPPSWQDARCSFIREASGAPESRSPDGAVPTAAELPRYLETPDSQGLTVPMGYESVPAAVAELSGEVLGEAVEALARLEQARNGADRLVISCANLIRVDFSAAGSILNWVANLQAEGCHLQFRDVHRLVAAFFNIIGINEHARVVSRSN